MKAKDMIEFLHELHADTEIVDFHSHEPILARIQYVAIDEDGNSFNIENTDLDSYPNNFYVVTV